MMAPFRSLVDVFAVLQPVLPYFVVYCMLIVRPHFPHDTIFEYIYTILLKTCFFKEKGSASPISSVRERATIDPFDGKGASLISSFANAYNNRDLPCRLMHGSVTHQLKWETDIEQLQYDPLVQIFAEGLVETRHPYHFVARKGLKELLNADGAGAKTTPIVQKLIAPIRATLISRDPDVYQGGIAALVDLSNAVGEALNPHIKLLLGQLAKNAMKPSFRDQVTDVLNVLETNGGKACYKMIKTKIPTYCTVNIGQLGINFNP